MLCLVTQRTLNHTGVWSPEVGMVQKKSRRAIVPSPQTQNPRINPVYSVLAGISRALNVLCMQML